MLSDMADATRSSRTTSMNRASWRPPSRELLLRRVASDLMDAPLNVPYELTGWKTHDSALEYHQHADAEVLRTALSRRRRA